MADLRAFFGALGFRNVHTLIQTGNVIFEHDATEGSELEALFELEARTRLGLDTSFFVRSSEEWRTAISANPFPAAAETDPGRTFLMALKDEPSPEDVAALRQTHKGPERFEAAGKHLYIHYPDGVGQSKLTSKLIENRLATRGTARNWNTVLKIMGRAERA